ncbi:hypothetical protein LS70_003755 [Helicobacter sp. MIT 11-5569]|uniref:hypothetical protein n=1 Tax=Helicobacter sp. MIT 11-5569 TaxID=1548151 RepID=UPI00051FCCFE|nr:hypothetical protein [Helicobacter sp. MIT 11-5569]TLD83933.1 hypothetical protein LS70_003755 [Helicobacter sp. MIT 11-5569]
MLVKSFLIICLSFIFAYGKGFTQYLGYEKVERLGFIEYYCIQGYVYMNIKVGQLPDKYQIMPLYRVFHTDQIIIENCSDFLMDNKELEKGVKND